MSRSRNSHPKTPEPVHGPKTRQAIEDRLSGHQTSHDRRAAGPREIPDAEVKHVHELELDGVLHTGKHRLSENRSQHDEADHNSDKTRLAKDAKKHKHGNPHGLLNGSAGRHKG